MGKSWRAPHRCSTDKQVLQTNHGNKLTNTTCPWARKCLKGLFFFIKILILEEIINLKWGETAKEFWAPLKGVEVLVIKCSILLIKNSQLLLLFHKSLAARRVNTATDLLKKKRKKHLYASQVKGEREEPLKPKEQPAGRWTPEDGTIEGTASWPGRAWSSGVRDKPRKI